ncbi:MULTISPECIES: 50S ribosomal protein L29 [Limnochorda]|mgnify:CR=1 FL=1|uniref:50S ribosomal protein L29 n=1 Tax=Limnochorda TaxID=1676651 RepID=UPI0017F4D733|nr:50S ribosomal protein L29 [Limnochorda pilosa]MBO2485692.1 50S ribosomal protein L29 [Bacillota bacterium]MBO2518216.1 50S ribosomal protein L29 [Bacillota bacterium]NMA71635.1 50S ribosomal protein L29 [Bacillota bacterium]
MKAEELRDLTSEELAQKVADLKEELFNLRFQMATGQLDNPMRLRAVRRDIARVRTVMRERELAEQPTSRTKRASRRRRG